MDALLGILGALPRPDSNLFTPIGSHMPKKALVAEASWLGSQVGDSYRV